MKSWPVLILLSLMVGLSAPASAAKRKSHHRTRAGAPVEEKHESGKAPGEDETADGKKQENPQLDFDFFGGQSAAPSEGGQVPLAAEPDLAKEVQTRRWMLKVHQTLGITTWLSMLATVIVGQLNYNQLYGGGGGSNKWQNPHRALVISTSTLFAATATFSLLAPTPYKKPLRFDTGLVHRIAVIGATLGMVTEVVLGWITTHQADAGNPHNLRTMAKAHQIVGYSTLGFLTIAGTVWVF
jgi:cytochrome b561